MIRLYAIDFADLGKISVFAHFILFIVSTLNDGSFILPYVFFVEKDQ